jgi:hypothetical protein
MATKTSPETAATRYASAQAACEDARTECVTAQERFSKARDVERRARLAYYKVTMPDDAAELSAAQLSELLGEYHSSSGDADDAWARVNEWAGSLGEQFAVEGYDPATGLPCVRLLLTRGQDTTALAKLIHRAAAMLPLCVPGWEVEDVTDGETPRRLILDPLEHTLSEFGSYTMVAERDENGVIGSVTASKTTYGRRETLFEGTLEEALEYAAKNLWYEDPNASDDTPAWD